MKCASCGGNGYYYVTVKCPESSRYFNLADNGKCYADEDRARLRAMELAKAGYKAMVLQAAAVYGPVTSYRMRDLR